MQENLVKCEVVLKSVIRTKTGVILKILVQAEDYTATMAVLSLDEPMELELRGVEVGI